jgi:hypothetical protein
MAAEPKSKLCFVIGPIGDEDSDIRVHADWLLELIIEPVMSNFTDFRVERADKLPQPGLIDAQVINRLLTAELVIADLTKLNPNAFYEIGIRHMAQKPIIHMQIIDEKPPFDVSLYRSIKFSLRRPDDLNRARDTLLAQVKAVMTPEYVVENPVTRTLGRIQLEQHATPEQQVILEQLQAMQNRLQVVESNNVVLGEWVFQRLGRPLQGSTGVAGPTGGGMLGVAPPTGVAGPTGGGNILS